MSEIAGLNHKTTRTSRIFSWLRFTVFIVAGLLVSVGAIVLVALIFPPGWIARDLFIQAVEDRTGRKLSVGGKAKLSLRPFISLKLDEVVLSGPEGASDQSPLRADGVVIRVNVLDWLGRRVEVPEVVLTRPTFTIRRSDPLFAKFAEGDISTGILPRQINVAGGTISFPSSTPDEIVKFEKVNGQFAPSKSGAKLSYKGTLVALNKVISVDGSLGNLAALAKGQASPLTLSATSDVVRAKLDGNLSTRPFGQVTGQLNATSNDLSGLLKWANVDAGLAKLGKVLSVEGKIAGSLNRLALTDGNVRLEAFTGKLSGEVSVEQDRPIVKASLATNKLDINKLLPQAARPAAFMLRPLEGVTALPSAWQSLLEGLESDETPDTGGRLGAAVQPLGWWSSKPFKLTALPDMDVELAIKAEEIRYGDLPFKQGWLLLNSNAKRLEILLNRLELYGGRVNGRVELDLAKGPLATGMKLKFNKMALGPFVSKLTQQRLIDGVADMDVSVSGRGGSMRELVGSLSGSATMQARQGAIIGYDLRRAILHFGATQPYNPARKTRFDRVKAGFSLSNGILSSSENLSLIGPDVDLISTGSVGLVSRRLDQRLRLSLKPPPLHLPIPLRIRGTVDKPNIGWDIFSAVAQPAKLATPFAVGARTEKMPAEVRGAIAAKLAADPSVSRLSPAARSFLEELLQSR